MSGGPPSRRIGRRRWFIAAGAAVVVAAVAVVVTTVLLGGSDVAPSPRDQRDRDARDVAAALAKLPADAATLRASTAALASTDVAAAVPSGTTVTADPASWQPDGAGGGVMTVTLKAPNGTSTTYLAVMVHEVGGWKVLQTVPASTGSATPSPTATSS